MDVAQKVKESEITEQDSLLLTRNLLRIAIFKIGYIRGLFPEKYFNDKSVPALDMKIKKLMPIDPESIRLIEKGVYDALQKKYLKTLLFCVCEAIDGPMIEEYAFSFSYSSSDSQEVSMNINRTGNRKEGSFKYNSTTEITQNQMRSSATKMIHTLIQLMRTLDKMPEERTILMKLHYFENVMPAHYEPPFFQGFTVEEAHNPWARTPLKMEVGKVNSKHLVLALKVKSVLDPCKDKNDGNQDDVSLEADSLQRDGDSISDSDASHSDEDQYTVAPVDKQQDHENSTVVDEDDTQDHVEDEEQLGGVNIPSKFPDISESHRDGHAVSSSGHGRGWFGSRELGFKRMIGGKFFKGCWLLYSGLAFYYTCRSFYDSIKDDQSEKPEVLAQSVLQQLHKLELESNRRSGILEGRFQEVEKELGKLKLVSEETNRRVKYLDWRIRSEAAVWRPPVWRQPNFENTFAFNSINRS